MCGECFTMQRALGEKLSYQGCGHDHNYHGMQHRSGLFNKITQTIACLLYVGIFIVFCWWVIKKKKNWWGSEDLSVINKVSTRDGQCVGFFGFVTVRVFSLIQLSIGLGVQELCIKKTNRKETKRNMVLCSKKSSLLLYFVQCHVRQQLIILPHQICVTSR